MGLYASFISKSKIISNIFEKSIGRSWYFRKITTKKGNAWIFMGELPFPGAVVYELYIRYELRADEQMIINLLNVSFI